MISEAGLLALFVLTAAAVTFGPPRVALGWWPLSAVVLALLATLISPGDVRAGLASCLDVLAFFAGLLLLAWALGRGGTMARLLDRAEALGGGAPLGLLLAVALATVAVTALLSNDAAALLLAPSVFERVQRRALPLAPFALTMAACANSASALLPISNPVNLLVLDRSHTALLAYLGAVTPPALLGVAITVGAAVWLARRWLPAAYSAQASAGREPAQTEDRRARAVVIVALALVVADIVCVLLRVPIGVPTLVAGVISAVLVVVPGGAQRAQLPRGWSLLPLVGGFSVLATGLDRSSLLSGPLPIAGHGLGPGLVVGLVSGGLSGVLNNLPAALLVVTTLQAGHHLGPLALPAIVGADLGPNLAPLGSLSTILIFRAARARAHPVPWLRAVCFGLILAPLSLLPTLCLVALQR